MFHRIWQTFGKAQQIISRNLEELAQRPNIIDTGLILVILNIRYLTLCHAHGITQLCLI